MRQSRHHQSGSTGTAVGATVGMKAPTGRPVESVVATPGIAGKGSDLRRSGLAQTAAPCSLSRRDLHFETIRIGITRNAYTETRV